MSGFVSPEFSQSKSAGGTESEFNCDGAVDVGNAESPGNADEDVEGDDMLIDDDWPVVSVAYKNFILQL